jgi:hypothetical protein
MSTDLDELIRSLTPVVVPGEFVYVTCSGDTSSVGEATIYATVREKEGISCVVKREDADQLGLSYSYIAGWITLEVHSALEAIGLTAAFSTALGAAGLSCNVIAGHYHDHILVPSTEVEKALQVLRRMASP